MIRWGGGGGFFFYSFFPSFFLPVIMSNFSIIREQDLGWKFPVLFVSKSAEGTMLAAKE